MLLYHGPSLLAPEHAVIAVITGLKNPSRNIKTGPMPQVFILRADIHPWIAVTNRQDAAICGGCIHRMNAGGQRSCYVNIYQQGISQVYESFRAGKYPLASDIRSIGKGRQIRVGAYGDPAAVPEAIWEQLLSESRGWTGYTHAWRKFPNLKRWFQASVDSEAEYYQAAQAGWGTFRVRKADEPVLSTEMVCPASKESAHREICLTCMRCNGSSHIAIEVHGTGKSHFRRLPVLQGT
jgi:hypothetical protein